MSCSRVNSFYYCIIHDVVRSLFLRFTSFDGKFIANIVEVKGFQNFTIILMTLAPKKIQR